MSGFIWCDLCPCCKASFKWETITDIIPTLKYEKPFDRLGHINELDIFEIKSSGYVVDTLEAALWVVGRKTSEPRDYSADVITAVNLGEDIDTVGAVTGGLAGIIYGLGDTGKMWLEKIRKIRNWCWIACGNCIWIKHT